MEGYLKDGEGRRGKNEALLTSFLSEKPRVHAQGEERVERSTRGR